MLDIIKFQGEKFNLGFTEVKNLKDFRIVVAEEENAIRKAAEDKNTDILLVQDSGRARDKVSSRDSGLNQVICKLAYDNKIAIGFSFSEVLNSKEKHKIIGRMMQNIRLCRKYKVKMILASFANNKWEMRAPRDLISFGIVLGMTGKEANEALNFRKKEREIRVVA